MRSKAVGAAVAVLALSWLEKAPCKSGAWTASLQYTHLCYSDVIPLYYAEELDKDKVPYAQHPVEYPVLTGAFMYATRTLSGWYDTLATSGLLPKVNPVESYFDVTAASPIEAIVQEAPRHPVFELVGAMAGQQNGSHATRPADAEQSTAG